MPCVGEDEISLFAAIFKALIRIMLLDYFPSASSPSSLLTLLFPDLLGCLDTPFHLTSLPPALYRANDAKDKNRDQEHQIRGKIEGNDVQVILTERMSKLWIRHVVCEQEQAPGANENEDLVEHLDEVVQTIHHWTSDEEVDQ